MDGSPNISVIVASLITWYKNYPAQPTLKTCYRSSKGYLNHPGWHLNREPWQLYSAWMVNATASLIG